jgi:hypothetical protein
MPSVLSYSETRNEIEEEKEKEKKKSTREYAESWEVHTVQWRPDDRHQVTIAGNYAHTAHTQTKSRCKSTQEREREVGNRTTV